MNQLSKRRFIHNVQYKIAHFIRVFQTLNVLVENLIHIFHHYNYLKHIHGYKSILTLL